MSNIYDYLVDFMKDIFVVTSAYLLAIAAVHVYEDYIERRDQNSNEGRLATTLREQDAVSGIASAAARSEFYYPREFDLLEQTSHEPTISSFTQDEGLWSSKKT